MSYKVETFGDWEGTLGVNGKLKIGTGKENFTVNTENPPQVVAEVRRIGDVPFRLSIYQDSQNPPVREV